MRAGLVPVGVTDRVNGDTLSCADITGADQAPSNRLSGVFCQRSPQSSRAGVTEASSVDSRARSRTGIAVSVRRSAPGARPLQPDTGRLPVSGRMSTVTAVPGGVSAL